MPRPNGGPRLVRKAGRDEWYVQRTVDGRTERISTRTADRETAEGFLAAFLTENVQRPVTHDPYLAEVIGAYIEARSPHIVLPMNLRERAKRINSTLGPVKISSLNAELGRRYQTARGEASTATVGDELALINAAIKWAAAEGLVAPIPPLKLPRRPPAKDRWLTPSEAAKLVAATKTRHVRLFVLLMLATASRPGALLTLTWSQVDFDNKRIHLNPPGRLQTSKRRSTVPISEDTVLELTSAKAFAKTDRVIEYHGEPVAAIKKAFARAANRAGFEDVSPHTLRHTAATWMAQDGVSMFEIAGFLGHTTARTTEMYAKHSPDYMDAAKRSLERRIDIILHGSTMVAPQVSITTRTDKPTR